MGQTSGKNYYDLLGVLPSATMTELKRSFREKAKSYHPDLNPDEEAQATFRDIQEAYNTLRDPVERTFYDRGLGIKSNWVEEAQKDSDRRRADRVGHEARRAADRAEAQTGTRSRSSRNESKSAPRNSSRAGFSPRSDDTKAKAKAGSSTSTGKRKTTAKDSKQTDDSSRRTGWAGKASTKAQEPRTRRNRRSSRFAPGNAARTSEGSRPSESYPPPPVTKTPWYKDKPLRIFLFATNILATIALFFTDPTRGIYFLVLAFGIELLYRLDEAKGQAIRPPPFRPPPPKS